MNELKGMPVVKDLAGRLGSDIEMLKTAGIVPKLAIVRVGERDDDLAYEKGILKRFSEANAVATVVALPNDCTQDELEGTINALNEDSSVHGILLFRPLPEHLSEERIKLIISPGKDVDGMGVFNTAHVFGGDRNCFPPCTPQAVIELLDYYGYDLTGRRVTVIGRSMVAGRPLSMLLLARNATVTVCHTKTKNIEEECRRADILVTCAGVAKLVDRNFVHKDQIVIDVGINMYNGRLCGDVDYEDVAGKVRAITPVPGGVGTVTTAVLLKHTVKSALRRMNARR